MTEIGTAVPRTGPPVPTEPAYGRPPRVYSGLCVFGAAEWLLGGQPDSPCPFTPMEFLIPGS